MVIASAGFGGTTGAPALAEESDPTVLADVVDPAGEEPGGEDPVTVDQPVVAAPDAPDGVVAGEDDESLTIGWSPPSSGTPVTSYTVTAEPLGPGVATPAPVVTSNGATFSADFDDLVNGMTYEITVTATNTFGSSPPSGRRGKPRTVPDAPTDIAAAAGDASATVRWQRPENNGGARIGRFIVTAEPSGTVKHVSGDDTSARVTGLRNGTRTTFTVAAVNEAGRGVASTAGGSVIPRAPARFVVQRQPSRRIVYGSRSSVRAALVTLNGVGVPLQRVDLLARSQPSGRWRRVATATTGDGGAVKLGSTLPASAALRLRHPASVVSAPSKDLRAVVVAHRVEAAPDRLRTRAGMRVVIRGQVAPQRAIGSPVRLQRRISGSWKQLAAGKMTTRRRFVIRWRPQDAGTYPLRVVTPPDRARAGGVSRTWTQRVDPESPADVARDILADRGITLAVVHLSAGSDGATAKQNIVDIANGRAARTSCYGGAPCRSTYLDLRMLRAIRDMGRRGTITVSEFAGGSHASSSGHYSGRAVDITWVNGRHVGWGVSYYMAVERCRAYGATQVMHPSSDPWGGHSRHIHCAWGSA